MPLPVAAAGALLPALAGALMWALRIYIASIIGRLLLTLGVGLVAYNYALPAFMTWVGQQFTALPEFVRSSVGYIGLDVVCTAVLSAMAVKAASRVFLARWPLP